MSVIVRMTARVRAAIAAIDEQAWTPIEYTDAVYDEPSGRWISRAEVAEIDFTAFTRLASERTPGRLVVRRIPDLNPRSIPGQGTLFDTGGSTPSVATTDLDTVAADKVHRGHAIVEQVHADLKNSALAHLPTGRFAANSAWLVLATMAFNLTRARDPDRNPAGQGDDRHHPAHPGHGPGSDRVLGPPAHPAPAAALAVETEWNHLFTHTRVRKPQVA